MIARLGRRLKSWEVALRTSWGDDISTPALRRQAKWHFHLFDHAWLRILWTNFDEVAPGVYRSNQPDPARLSRLREMGIRTIVNLRGTPRQSHYLFEAEACAALGLAMVNLQLHARRAAPRSELLALIETFRTAEKPLLMHCKSGADRAGLAAAIYLLAIEGRSVAQARRQLGPRYVHLRWTDTGICDHLLDAYQSRLGRGEIGFEAWIATEYDPAVDRAELKGRGMGRKVLEIGGPDRVPFLQGLVTNDLGRLKDGLVWAAILTPQGKYLADFFLKEQGEAILVDADVAQAPGLVQRLAMYRLRAAVTIGESGLSVRRGTGPAPEGALPDPRHPAMGWRHYGAEGGDDGSDFDRVRVAHCIPAAGIELIPNETFILEAGFERLHGVDFRKGCYVGQEVTARMKHKTDLRKGLATVEVAGAAPVGTALLTADGKEAGALYTQADGRGIAYLRFDRADAPLRAGAATVRLAAMDAAS